jgi:predicted ester cyclase
MKNTQLVNESTINAKEVVMEYLEAANRKDWKSARSYVNDNVSYVGPLNSFDKAEPYLKYFEHLDLPKMDIKKVFVDGNDVCEFHEVNVDTQPEPLLVCMWFHVDDGKIGSIRIVFDPRPFLPKGR